MDKAESLSYLSFVLEDSCKKGKRILNLPNHAATETRGFLAQARECAEKTLTNFLILIDLLEELLEPLSQDNNWNLYMEYAANFDGIEILIGKIQEMISEVDRQKDILDVYVNENIFDRRAYRRNLKTALNLMKSLLLRSILLVERPDNAADPHPFTEAIVDNNLVSHNRQLEVSVSNVLQKVFRNMNSYTQRVAQLKTLVADMFCSADEMNHTPNCLTIIKDWSVNMRSVVGFNVSAASDVHDTCVQLLENYETMQRIAVDFHRIKFYEEVLSDFTSCIRTHFIHEEL